MQKKKKPPGQPMQKQKKPAEQPTTEEVQEADAGLSANEAHQTESETPTRDQVPSAAWQESKPPANIWRRL